jgi:CheY-like chemotaxis protein
MSIQNHDSEGADAGVLQGLRILVVEDELLVALDTQAFVWRFGGIVVGPYARVPAALQALEVHPVDGAILDVNVAGTQSFAVADVLRQRNIPFVFCTGYSRETVPPRFDDAPVVEKPLVPELVIAALVEALKASAAQADR